VGLKKRVKSLKNRHNIAGKHQTVRLVDGAGDHDSNELDSFFVRLPIELASPVSPGVIR
jgi:hypothetical protein